MLATQIAITQSKTKKLIRIKPNSRKRDYSHLLQFEIIAVLPKSKNTNVKEKML